MIHTCIVHGSETVILAVIMSVVMAIGLLLIVFESVVNSIHPDMSIQNNLLYVEVWLQSYTFHFL